MTGKDRVLVVDDHRDTLEIISVLLDVLGYETRTTTRGREAVQAARDYDPDLILVDINLPDITGYEVVEAIRAEKRHGGPFIVALTGYGRDQDIANAKRAGFDEHHLKPIDLARVKGILRSSAARRERRRQSVFELERGAMLAG